MAILDITGVRGVDAQVMSCLTRAAAAVRLVGAQVILSGAPPSFLGLPTGRRRRLAAVGLV